MIGRALGYRVGLWLRRHLRSTVMVAILVAVVLTPVLGLWAGARRTATVADRYVAAHPSEFDFGFQQEWGEPRVAEVEALPGVERAIGVTFMFAGLIPAGSDQPLVEGLTFAGDAELWGESIVAGRAADPDNPTEFVASETWAALGPFAPGDTFTLVTISADAARAGGFAALGGAPDGPTAAVTLVGVFATSTPQELGDDTQIAIFPPSVTRLGSIGFAATLGALVVAPGVDADELRRQFDTLPDGSNFQTSELEVVSDLLRDAIATRARGYTILAAIVSAAAAAVLIQILVRQHRIDDDERPALAALGYTRAQAATEPVGRAAPAVLVGAAGAAVAAWALSGWFPHGLGRSLEPAPGTRLDPRVHVIGAALAGAVLLGMLAVLVRRRATRHTPAQTLDRIAARIPSATAATGVRLAFGRGRQAPSTNPMLFGVATVLAIAVAATTVGASLNALVGDPARWGERGDLGFGQGGEALAPEVVPTLVGSDLVRAVTLFGQVAVAVGSDQLKVVGFVPAKGVELPEVLSGRLPAAPGEIAVSTPAARRFGLAIGDTISVTGPGGPLELSVVGTAVVPGVDGAEVGEPLVLVNEAGFQQVNPGNGMTTAMIFLSDGAPPDAPEQLYAALAPDLDVPAGFELPPRVENFRRVGDLPTVITVVVGVLGVLSLGHLVVSAVQRRRADLAVLRALGATPRWVRRVVHWQASLMVAFAVASGTFAGVMLGRIVFRPFPEQIGARPGSDVPWASLAVGAAGLLLAANAVATALTVRRRSAGRDLRAE